MPPREPVGYQALIEDFDLRVIPHFRESYVADRGERRVERSDGQERHIYPRKYRPRDESRVAAHLEFALKHDGINLSILKALFRAVPPADVAGYVRSKPTGKYARRVWFLWEWLTGNTLDVPDALQGTYVDVLEPDDDVVGDRRPSPRHRVYDNLLGVPAFCPVVRWTETLKAFASRDLGGRVRDIVNKSDRAALARASRYLYVKETRSSYEIESERPTADRTRRFVSMLERAHRLRTLDKATLLELQEAMLDPRFAPGDYRTAQNYVGETARVGRELVHYVSPQPQGVQGLMAGFFACSERMLRGSVDPVVQAAALSFGFVFIHPFEDGNGRTHRFLIHWILSRAGFTPPGMIFPVSAVMLANRAAYDRALETFSAPLLGLLDYELAPDGRLTVGGETADLYRYVDITPQAEYLYGVIEQTIDHEFVDELEFLARYDRAKERLQSIVDMPDRQIDLFIRLVHQQRGRLSKRKREGEFSMLSDDEVSRLEEAVAEEFEER